MTCESAGALPRTGADGVGTGALGGSGVGDVVGHRAGCPSRSGQV